MKSKKSDNKKGAYKAQIQCKNDLKSLWTHSEEMGLNFKNKMTCKMFDYRPNLRMQLWSHLSWNEGVLFHLEIHLGIHLIERKLLTRSHLWIE